MGEWYDEWQQVLSFQLRCKQPLNLQMFFTIALKELDDFAPIFWQQVGDAKVFAFYGEMGAGKTTIIEALCKSKGVQHEMSSPTYSIINQYAYPENGEQKIIYHIDLYRLNNDEEIAQAGVEDCLYSGDLCMVEWPQKAPHLFDENTIAIQVETLTETERIIKLQLP